MPPGRTSLPRQATAARRSSPASTSVEGGGEADGNAAAAAPVPAGPAPVAIDLGAYSIRITVGWDADSSVVVRCPNAIVRQAQRRYNKTSGGSGSSTLIGPQIHAQCTNFGSLSIRQPMDRGLVVDWAAQKAVLDAALVELLMQEKAKGKAGAANGKAATLSGRLLEGRPVVLTEAYLNLPDLQTAMDLLLMEEYGAGSIWRAAPAYMIPYTPNLFIPPPAAGRKRSRPECMLIVDLGHGGSHVVPVVGDKVIWKAVRRHVISQRLLTNLLKESLSFRQWDMMDESWLVGHIKEKCCFLAACAGRRGDTLSFESQTPSQWSFAALLEMCESTAKAKNPIVQEYVLPDYSGPSLAAKYGFVRRGPGRVPDSHAKRGSTMLDDDDKFIADMGVTGQEANGMLNGIHDAGETASSEEEDSSDDDFDGAGDESDENGTSRPRKKQKKIKTNGTPKKAGATRQVDDEAEQVLILERERFQVPEVMFNPGIIGLDDAPLHEVIRASIEACDERIRGPMWANVVLVGGGARMRGLQRRLVEELRPLAPSEAPLHIYKPQDPAMATILGAQAILTSAQGSSPNKMLRSRLLPSAEYNVPGSRERFGSWSSV